MIIARIIAVAIGYACGLFETGYFYGKRKVWISAQKEAAIPVRQTP